MLELMRLCAVGICAPSLFWGSMCRWVSYIACLRLVGSGAEMLDFDDQFQNRRSSGSCVCAQISGFRLDETACLLVLVDSILVFAK